jgi:hypothetical protein
MLYQNLQVVALQPSPCHQLSQAKPHVLLKGGHLEKLAFFVLLLYLWWTLTKLVVVFPSGSCGAQKTEVRPKGLWQQTTRPSEVGMNHH